MGYGGSRDEAAAVTQKTGDEGIDGVINKDIGPRCDLRSSEAMEVRRRQAGNSEFVGALAGKKAGKGIFITTSEIHDNARDYAARLTAENNSRRRPSISRPDD